MRKYKGLDFKKLDDYKQAIDDGFEYYFKEDAGNYPTDFYEIFLYKDFGTGNYNFADIVGTENIEYKVVEKDWNIFKERVRKYYEGFYIGGINESF